MSQDICNKGRERRFICPPTNQTHIISWRPLDLCRPICYLSVPCPPAMWSRAVRGVYTWGGYWLMKSWLRFHVWPDWHWAVGSLKLLRRSRGVSGCGEKQPSVLRSFLSLSWELLIPTGQIVFSGGYGFMEIRWFRKAADSVKLAELF